MDIFLKVFNILVCTVCVCADGFHGHLEAFLLPFTIFDLLLASLKLLTNFENAY